MVSEERRNRIGILLGNISYLILFLSIPTAYFLFTYLTTTTGIRVLSFLVFFAFLLAFIGQGISTGEANKPTKRAATITFLIVVTLVCVLYNYSNMEAHRSYQNRAAKSAGIAAAEAEKKHFKKTKRYTDSLEDLLKIDQSLTNTNGVTFRFLHASSSGYTFYTRHKDTTDCHIFSKKSQQLVNCIDLPDESK